MLEKVTMFLQMFTMELEDLHKDIELLIEKYKDEHDHEVISNYVFLENLALMKNELFGIDSFLQEVKEIVPASYTDVHDLITHLKKQLLNRCHEKGIASSAFILSERKMNKVLSYIDEHSLHQQDYFHLT
ncbi:MAG: hypothetical protein JW915_21570 [Chitinispirillaceae bacterium]|nr:hypothetical protein [Chitinispirillaceae bacterium]